MTRDTPEHQSLDAHGVSLGDDLLIGAEAIARELNWKAQDGGWNRRRVYHLAEQGNMPIHRVKGLGVCARRSALKEFFDGLDARLLCREPNE